MTHTYSHWSFLRTCVTGLNTKRANSTYGKSEKREIMRLENILPAVRRPKFKYQQIDNRVTRKSTHSGGILRKCLGMA